MARASASSGGANAHGSRACSACGRTSRSWKCAQRCRRQSAGGAIDGRLTRGVIRQIRHLFPWSGVRTGHDRAIAAPSSMAADSTPRERRLREHASASRVGHDGIGCSRAQATSRPQRRSARVEPPRRRRFLAASSISENCARIPQESAAPPADCDLAPARGYSERQGTGARARETGLIDMTPTAVRNRKAPPAPRFFAPRSGSRARAARRRRGHSPPPPRSPVSARKLRLIASPLSALRRTRRAIVAAAPRGDHRARPHAAAHAIGETTGDLGQQLGPRDGCQSSTHAREPRRQRSSRRLALPR